MTRRKSFARIGDILAIFLRIMSEKKLSVFVDIRNEALISGYGHLKIYYDCGQPEVTNVLQGILEERFFGGSRDFKRNVLRQLKAKEL